MMEIRFPGCVPVEICATAFTGFPLDKTSHCTKNALSLSTLLVASRKIYRKFFRTWALPFSSFKKLKRFSFERGSQREVAALTMKPSGWPGPLLFCIETRTPLFLYSDGCGKSSLSDMLSTSKKFFIILWESFIRFLCPSSELITEWRMKTNNYLNHTFSSNKAILT